MAEQEDLILDEEAMEEKAPTLWAWLRLEGLLIFAILLGQYGPPSTSNQIITIVGSIGWLCMQIIIPLKRTETAEIEKYWHLGAAFSFAVYLSGVLSMNFSAFAFNILLQIGGLSLIIAYFYLGFRVLLQKKLELGLKTTISIFGFLISSFLLSFSLGWISFYEARPLNFWMLGFSLILLLIFALLLLFRWEKYKILRFYIFRIVLVIGSLLLAMI